jgi:hypothetical protein
MIGPTQQQRKKMNELLQQQSEESKRMSEDLERRKQFMEILNSFLIDDKILATALGVSIGSLFIWGSLHPEAVARIAQLTAAGVTKSAELTIEATEAVIPG